MSAVGKKYGAECLVFWYYNKKTKKLKYLTSWYKSSLKNSEFIYQTKNKNYDPESDIIGKTLSSKRKSVTRTYPKKIGKDRGMAAESLGLRNAIFIPVINNSIPEGVLEVVMTDDGRDTKGVENILENISQLMGMYIYHRVTGEQLALSEEKSYILTELAPAIIYIVDKNNKITSLNPAVEAITGLKRSDLIGKDLINLICPEDREYALREFKNSRQAEDIYSFEVNIVTKSNEIFVAEIKEKTNKINNRTVETLGIIRDVTERYHLEKQKDLWIGIATHELKTPLTSIKAYTQILQNLVRNDKNAKQEYGLLLSKIEDVTSNMSLLIQDLLDITKIKSGKLELNLDNVDLGSIIENTCSEIQPITPSHKIEINVKGMHCVKGDSHRLRQVFLNIIENAVKYSPGAEKILIESRTEGKEVLISVKDFGAGIQPNKIGHIFEIFYRGDSEKDQKTAGLGLGLFIAKAIIEAHNGAIWVDSKVGEGTTFFMSLPLLPHSECSTL